MSRRISIARDEVVNMSAFCGGAPLSVCSTHVSAYPPLPSADLCALTCALQARRTFPGVSCTGESSKATHSPGRAAAYGLPDRFRYLNSTNGGSFELPG